MGTHHLVALCTSLTTTQFWKSGPKAGAVANDDGHVPDDWLEADIKQGISDHDVETRRKKFGFNEIMSEKENMFLKFLGFFRGPILYGESPTASRSFPANIAHAMLAQWTCHCHTFASGICFCCKLRTSSRRKFLGTAPSRTTAGPAQPCT